MYRLLFFAVTCTLCSTANLAQPYPSKPIRLLVSDSPGGLADTIGRIIGNGLGEVIGQRIVIENRAGAASNIGALVVVHPALLVKTLSELVKLAKARPGNLPFASAGTGAPTVMAGEPSTQSELIALHHWRSRHA